jgi:sigma-B regulation protein RsbU (phosphoserine phosphatase)
LNNIDGSLSVDEILAEVRKDIEIHAEGAEQSDDITMLAVRFLGKAGAL